MNAIIQDEKSRLKWTAENGLNKITDHPCFSSVNWDQMVGSCEMTLD